MNWPIVGRPLNTPIGRANRRQIVGVSGVVMSISSGSWRSVGTPYRCTRLPEMKA